MGLGPRVDLPPLDQFGPWSKPFDATDYQDRKARRHRVIDDMRAARGQPRLLATTIHADSEPPEAEPAAVAVLFERRVNVMVDRPAKFFGRLGDRIDRIFRP